MSESEDEMRRRSRGRDIKSTDESGGDVGIISLAGLRGWLPQASLSNPRSGGGPHSIPATCSPDRFLHPWMLTDSNSAFSRYSVCPSSY